MVPDLEEHCAETVKDSFSAGNRTQNNEFPCVLDLSHSMTADFWFPGRSGQTQTYKGSHPVLS